MNLNNEQRIIDEIGKLRKEVERLKRVESGGIWTDWTPKLTGFSSDPPNSIYRYCLVGKMCSVIVSQASAGTSNANNFYISAPFKARYQTSNSIARMQDAYNYSYGVGMVNIGTGSQTFVLYTATGDTGWTASSGKSVTFTITYEIE